MSVSVSLLHSQYKQPPSASAHRFAKMLFPHPQYFYLLLQLGGWLLTPMNDITHTVHAKTAPWLEIGEISSHCSVQTNNTPFCSVTVSLLQAHARLVSRTSISAGNSNAKSVLCQEAALLSCTAVCNRKAVNLSKVKTSKPEFMPQFLSVMPHGFYLLHDLTSLKHVYCRGCGSANPHTPPPSSYHPSHPGSPK